MLISEKSKWFPETKKYPMKSMVLPESIFWKPEMKSKNPESIFWKWPEMSEKIQ